MAKDDFGGMGVALVAVAAYLIIMKKTGSAAVPPSSADYRFANTLPTSKGNTGSDAYVAWVQQALNQILGAGLAVDGVMDANTRAWVIKFQQAWQITADGIVGPETDYSLRSALAQPGYIDQPYQAAGVLQAGGTY